MAKKITKLLFEAKKGKIVALDSIYLVQEMGEYGGTKWWTSCDENDYPADVSRKVSGERVLILRDVKIEVKVTEWE